MFLVNLCLSTVQATKIPIGDIFRFIPLLTISPKADYIVRKNQYPCLMFRLLWLKKDKGFFQIMCGREKKGQVALRPLVLFVGAEGSRNGNEENFPIVDPADQRVRQEGLSDRVF